ncbi:MAG: peptidyl-prolyl cis-trans isomerase [Candidatus Omnitrophica bacterium]|jgi:peptidyl-prolyl cis-trans isomerase C|nr:peptidyl-prolyl cis-trans isomerase [Candidatus Omnitrophota bacterium]
MNRLVLLLASGIFIFYGLTGCQNNSANLDQSSQNKEAVFQISAKGKIIARVNNIPIGLDDLNQEIQVYNSMVPAGSPEAKISTREEKIDYLKNEMVRRTLLYQSALNRKLQQGQDFKDALQKAALDLLVVALIKDEAKNIKLTPEEIRNYYDMYKSQFKATEEINIREIVLPSEDEAKDVLVWVLKEEDFAVLAKKYSKGKSANSNGNLGFLSSDALFEEMNNNASKLQVGQASGIFRGPEGYYIIKVEARRGGEQMTLEQAKDEIQRALIFIKQQQRLEEIIIKLADQSKIEIYEKEVE